ncbi:hypothetical protein LP421_10815 [Rhizobium sp. RCAM05350]|nr:hypothetical protein LP421_10815 [Rhizobium sp. RCAM05350]
MNGFQNLEAFRTIFGIGRNNVELSGRLRLLGAQTGHCRLTVAATIRPADSTRRMHRAHAFIDASWQEENPSSSTVSHVATVKISRQEKRKYLRQKGTVVTGF